MVLLSVDPLGLHFFISFRFFFFGFLFMVFALYFVSLKFWGDFFLHVEVSQYLNDVSFDIIINILCWNLFPFDCKCHNSIHGVYCENLLYFVSLQCNFSDRRERERERERERDD